MKPILITAFILVITAVNAQKPVDSKQQEIMIRIVNVIPMNSEQVINNQVVVKKNGVITQPGDPQKIK